MGRERKTKKKEKARVYTKRRKIEMKKKSCHYLSPGLLTHRGKVVAFCCS